MKSQEVKVPRTYLNLKRPQDMHRNFTRNQLITVYNMCIVFTKVTKKTTFVGNNLIEKIFN